VCSAGGSGEERYFFGDPVEKDMPGVPAYGEFFDFWSFGGEKGERQTLRRRPVLSASMIEKI